MSFDRLDTFCLPHAEVIALTGPFPTANSTLSRTSVPHLRRRINICAPSSRPPKSVALFVDYSEWVRSVGNRGGCVEALIGKAAMAGPAGSP
ncbi:hypothetical protein BAUCODRAFT_31578 [Baudoinia panamericana UAMH 10762]|uniref:Uncharacterized protein n=1 Tax=Baudoinia panamericana (strain UAMH 10762) TaxID=717646 RepID=M2N5D1_BAUPA|nr:uncharacterized protein BAUCODRAFT_31578 [Baudoinia panamericana UAMH 10762]EMC99238.1 hypothetical protein BAUCODRAFT_31578 [Baudoinia panamericana UAMH 10762]